MRVLEFMNKNDLAPVGGSCGYVYTLYMEDKGNNTLSFLNRSKSVNSAVNNKNNDIIIRLKKDLSLTRNLLFGKNSPVIESNHYDIIHFHSTEELYKYRKSLKKFNGVTVLTSHSPTLLSKEYLDASKKWEKVLFFIMFKILPIMDFRAFDIANYIVFPCPEAEEPYYNAWSGYNEFRNKNSAKYRYLLSGTFSRFAKKSRSEVREELGIPKEAFLITYAGRHNKIKGYELLKNIGMQYADSSEVFFLVAGKEEPIKGLRNKNWIEVGWTNDPHSLIAAGDVFILPNEETYFDLILLELMSLGKIALIRDTGGNKYFDSSYKGILHFKGEEDCVEQIEYIRNLSKDMIRYMEEDNIRKFNERFSSRVFYEDYLSLLKSISGEDADRRNTD